MKVYISGPMTGYVEHNFPAFNAAANHLRGKGYEVVNPAEMDDPSATHEELAAIPHWWYLRRDIKALVECDAIFLLPGWRWSKGATLEAQVADGTGIMRLLEPDDETWRSFEGEPVTTKAVELPDAGEKSDPVDHTTCPPVEGNGRGSEWCEHGRMVTEPTLPEGISILPCNVMPLPMRDYLATYGNEIDRKISRHHRDGD